MSFLKPDLTLEKLNARIGENLPGYLGLTMIRFGENEMVSRMELKKIHFAPNTYLHAGSLVTLADTTAGFGTFAHLPEGSSGFTTIELKSNFFKTLREGSLICVATAQHLGRNTQVWDAEVFNEANNDRLCMFRCTQMILWPNK
ncbi:PaaI family thioesterase [Orrella sp. 11846]|uniref:PaaI family thioesterase n=1 Tax=Orrella sp. 11846 TaxID=3409913 RepID=UPI003B5CC4A2